MGGVALDGVAHCYWADATERGRGGGRGVVGVVRNVCEGRGRCDEGVVDRGLIVQSKDWVVLWRGFGEVSAFEHAAGVAGTEIGLLARAERVA